MDNEDQRLATPRAIRISRPNFSLVMVSVVGLAFFGYNAQLEASRAANKPWINFFFVMTFLDMALLYCLLILHSSIPEAFEKWGALKKTTLASIVSLTLAFLLHLWVIVPPSMGWLVWVCCGIMLSSALAMAFLSNSLTHETH
ncbi:hypothetical protein AMTR_s00078p00077700 [Amborella trichopoda]|uniref:Uncharacterized protein n=1 Tax=Amborella trichopoda TaxID=13333 RepID=W1P7X9_AMBTC|nr:hypothetical protein AMTR_s00078p00077700 [Amborella trichopoda]